MAVSDDAGPYIVYKISCGSIAVYRRYSLFVELNEALREELHRPEDLFCIESDWPVFPPTKLCGRLDQHFVEERQKLLNEWICEMLNIPGVEDSLAYKAFMSPKQTPCSPNTRISNEMRRRLTTITNTVASAW
jgi:hypothetical protein